MDPDFFRWREETYACLRNIARKVSAWLNEPDDKAMAGTLDDVRGLLVDYKNLQLKGLARGWTL